MALTRACGSMCSFCYAVMQEPQKRAGIKNSHALNLLDDFASIGVRGVSLISDGESTLSKSYVPFIQHAAEVGIDVGNATNAWEWGPEKIEQVLPHLSWVRFTVAAGTPERYAEIMYKGAEHAEVFDKAIKNIKYAVEFKKRNNLPVTLGIQMVLMPEFKDEIIPFSQLGLDLGVDYTVIKHCSDDEKGRLGVDYGWYKSLIAIELLKTAEAISTNEYSVQAKWSKMMTGRDRKYSKCFGPPLFLQISGTGIVAPCGSFFHSRYSQYHIGDLKEQSFYDIWSSDKYNEVMGYISSDKFDAKKQCATLCLQDKVNEVLNDLVENDVWIDDVGRKKVPDHINFI